MTYHGVNRRSRVLGGDLDGRMTPGKHAKQLVGEALSHRLHVPEIEHDFAEFLEVGGEPLRLGAGDKIAPQELHEHFRSLELEVVLLGRKLAEDFVQAPSTAAIALRSY